MTGAKGCCMVGAKPRVGKPRLGSGSGFGGAGGGPGGGLVVLAVVSCSSKSNGKAITETTKKKPPPGPPEPPPGPPKPVPEPTRGLATRGLVPAKTQCLVKVFGFYAKFPTQNRPEML